MKKLLSILGVFAFVATPAMTVISCGNNNETDSGENTSIGNIQNHSSLGIFKTAPTKANIEATLKARAIDVSQLEVGEPANGSVTITVNDESEVYPPKTVLTLTYGIGDRADITTIFVSNSLGEFDTTPTETMIKERLHRDIDHLAPGLVEADLQVDVTGGPAFDGTTGAFRADFSVKDSSTIYNRSWVHMNYTVKPQEETPTTFADEVALPKLGEKLKTFALDSSSYTMHLAASDLIKMVGAKNSDLTPEMLNELQVTANSAGGSATIGVSPSATLLDPKSEKIEVSFAPVMNITSGTAKLKIGEEEKQVSGIWNRNLGQLASDATVDQIIEAVTKANKNVVKAEIELTAGSFKTADGFGTAIIHTKKVAEGQTQFYKGDFSVMVYFTVSQPAEA